MYKDFGEMFAWLLVICVENWLNWVWNIQKFDLYLSGSLIDGLSFVGRLVQIIFTPKLLHVYNLGVCLTMVAFE